MTVMPESPETLTSLSYPRTGKRGVPQQFPRRLFEMLESESKLMSTDANHLNIIVWSDTGNAFRILDVALFSSHILPKYFRTSKFSSFQRNLNLYGFSKVRRGPDTDMYAHPSFARGRVDTLSDLRKCNSAAARKRNDNAVHTEHASLKVVLPQQTEYTQQSRAVSPSQSPPRMLIQAPAYPTIVTLTSGTNTNTHYFMPSVWTHATHIVPMSHSPVSVRLPIAKPAIKVETGGTSRLNLLAMAMTSIAERESRFEATGPVMQTAQANA